MLAPLTTNNAGSTISGSVVLSIQSRHLKYFLKLFYIISLISSITTSMFAEMKGK